MSIRKPAVLIVDDQPDNVDLLTEVLRSEYDLLAATDAKHALELAPSADLILLDIRMPEMDGIELCRLLRAEETTRHIPVIFVTGLAQTEQEKLGFDVGAVDYITKPIKPASVRARVRNHLELKAARDRLELLASSDPLTGIGNRRLFEDSLQEQWRRCARPSRFLTVAIADIDHFKGFNDRHGHLTGDACLRAVAQALAGLCRRPGEIVARYGGEEFAFVLPEVDGSAATRFLARVLDAVSTVEVPGVVFQGDVALSVGAVALIPSRARSHEDAVRAADEVLYKAKRDGRRRGVITDLETGVSMEVLPEKTSS